MFFKTGCIRLRPFQFWSASVCISFDFWVRPFKRTLMPCMTRTWPVLGQGGGGAVVAVMTHEGWLHWCSAH